MVALLVGCALVSGSVSARTSLFSLLALALLASAAQPFLSVFYSVLKRSLLALKSAVDIDCAKALLPNSKHAVMATPLSGGEFQSWSLLRF
jgi:hypothetical protein